MVSADCQSTEKSMKHLLLAAIVLGVGFCFGKSTGIWWLIVTIGKQFFFWGCEYSRQIRRISLDRLFNI